MGCPDHEGGPPVSGDPTAEELVRFNSHELTAHLLVTERLARVEERERWERERQRLLGSIGHAGRIGFRVMLAKSSGRKTVRIADVVEEDQ